MKLTRVIVLGALALASFAGADSLTVQQAVKLAEQNRASIRASSLKVRQAEFDRAAAGAYPVTRAEVGDGTMPDFQAGEDMLIAQPIDLFSKTAAARRTADAALLAARAGYRQARLDLQTEVITAFADARAAQEALSTGKALSDIAERVYAATKTRVDSGDLPPAQLLRSDLDRERAAVTLNIRQKALQAAGVRFAAVLGVAQTTPLDFAASETFSPSPSGRRPDLDQLASDIDAARGEQLQAKRSLFPDMELQFRRNFWSQPESYNARVQLVIPLWDHGASHARWQAGKAAEQAAISALADRKSTAEAEIGAAKLDLDAAQSSVESYDRLSRDAGSLLQKEERGFALGASTLLDVLDATRALREIQDSAIAARSDLLKAQAHYLAVKGAILAEVSR